MARIGEPRKIRQVTVPKRDPVPVPATPVTEPIREPVPAR